MSKLLKSSLLRLTAFAARVLASQGWFWFLVAQGLGKMELNTKFYMVASSVCKSLSLFSLYVQNLIFLFFFLIIAI